MLSCLPQLEPNAITASSILETVSAWIIRHINALAKKNYLFLVYTTLPSDMLSALRKKQQLNNQVKEQLKKKKDKGIQHFCDNSELFFSVLPLNLWQKVNRIRGTFLVQ